MIDLLLLVGAIGLVIVLWICIWNVGWIIVPVGIVMTAIVADMVKDL